MIEDWGRELPPGPILWIDSGLMERIVLAHGRATRKEGRLGRLLVVLVARRLHDPALLTAALAAAVGVAAPSAELKSDVAAVVGPLARALAADGLAGLERSAGEDALGTIDFFRIRQVLHAAAVDGKAEETEARLAALLGRVASGTLQADVEALLSGGAGSVAAGEVERSLRELSALSREGGISGLVADLTAIAAAIAARLRLDPGGPELLYRLHLLELCGGAEMAHALYRELRPGGRATRAGS